MTKKRMNFEEACNGNKELMTLRSNIVGALQHRVSSVNWAIRNKFGNPNYIVHIHGQWKGSFEALQTLYWTVAKMKFEPHYSPEMMEWTRYWTDRWDPRGPLNEKRFKEAYETNGQEWTEGR